MASQPMVSRVLEDTLQQKQPYRYTMTHVTKHQFVSLLNEAGITDAQKHRLHQVFEQQHPEAHQAFLEWLGVPAEEVRAIREHARK